jgi:hypothetical protein
MNAGKSIARKGRVSAGSRMWRMPVRTWRHRGSKRKSCACRVLVEGWKAAHGEGGTGDDEHEGPRALLRRKESAA